MALPDSKPRPALYNVKATNRDRISCHFLSPGLLREIMQGKTADDLAQTEQVRQDYLEAMGVQTWFPRYQLSNARPARAFDWIKEDAAAWQQKKALTQTSQPEVAKVGPAETGYTRLRASDILSQAAIDDFSKKESKKEPGKESEKESDKKEIPEEKPAVTRRIGTPATSKFRLVVQKISDDCLVVAEMPHSGLNQFTRFHQQLLDDVLFALNIQPANPQPVKEFIWPISDNRGLMSQLNQDDDAAADAVCAYLSNQFGLSHHKIVLLLGQAAARFVIDPNKAFDDLRGMQEGTHSQQVFAVSHGLNELMKLSHLKAEAWQDLAPLQRFMKKRSTTENNQPA